MYKRRETQNRRPLKRRYKPRIAQREKLADSRMGLVARLVVPVIILVVIVALAIYRPSKTVRLRIDGTGFLPEMEMLLEDDSVFRFGNRMNKDETVTSHQLAIYSHSISFDEPEGCVEVSISPQQIEVGKREVDFSEMFETSRLREDPYDSLDSIRTTPISSTTTPMSLQVFEWLGYVDRTHSVKPETDIISYYEVRVRAGRAYVIQGSYEIWPIVLEILDLSGDDTRIELYGSAPDRFFAHPEPNSKLLGRTEGCEPAELWTFEPREVTRGQIEPPDEMTAVCTCPEGCQISIMPRSDGESEQLLDILFLSAELVAKRLFIRNVSGELVIGTSRISVRRSDSVEIHAIPSPYVGLIRRTNLRESIWPESNWRIDMDTRSNFVLLNGEQLVPTLWDHLHEDIRYLLTTLLVSVASAWLVYEVRERTSGRD